MAEPTSPRKEPYVEEAAPGTYAWCACGQSAAQPYCDGSHKGTGMTPIIEKVEEKKTIAWCGCKHSQTKPHCDGSHNKL